MTDSDGGAKTSIRVLGLVNAAAPLSLEQQRRTLMDAGCEYAFEVTEAAGSDKKVGDLLRRLGPGSRLVLTGLGALNRSIAECLWLAANLLEAGVEICIVDQHSARTLGLSASTLKRWRCEGGGPRYHKLGGRIRYRVADMEAFMAANRHRSTSASDTGAQV